MRTLLFILILAIASACNSVDKNAVTSIIASGNASIQGSAKYENAGIYTNKRMFWVVEIDGVEVKEQGYFRVYQLSPGSHKLVIGGSSFDGRFGAIDTKGGVAAVTLTASARHEYEVRGSASGEAISVFVFDLSDQVAVTPSAVVEAIHKETKEMPIVVPIPIL